MVLDLKIAEDHAAAFTTTELAYLEQFLTAGDRAGFYLAYYGMVGGMEGDAVGAKEMALQAKISTFSDQVGAVAYYSNRILQENEGGGNPTPYKGIYFLSQQVALQTLQLVKDSVDSGNTGEVSDEDLFAGPLAAWSDANNSDLFPGNIFTNSASQNASILAAILGWVGLSLQSGPSATRSSFVDYIGSDGAAAGIAAAMYVALAGETGKSTDDYSGSNYETITMPDGSLTVVVEKTNPGRIVAIDDDFFGSSQGTSETLLETGAFGASAIATAASIVSGAYSLTPLTLINELNRLLHEAFDPHEPAGSNWTSLSENALHNGSDGDADPAATNGSYQAHESTFRSEASSGNDTLSTYQSNAVNGGSGDDTIFGNDNDNSLQGGNDDDILYGQLGDDILEGQNGVDILRGGEGDDHFYGGSEVNKASWEDHTTDYLIGGAGYDTYHISFDKTAGTLVTGNYAALLESVDIIYDEDSSGYIDFWQKNNSGGYNERSLDFNIMDFTKDWAGKENYDEPYFAAVKINAPEGDGTYTIFIENTGAAGADYALFAIKDLDLSTADWNFGFNDNFYGSAINNDYGYQRGGGNAQINESGLGEGRADTLTLTGVSINDISLQRDGDNVTIIIAESSPGLGDGGEIILEGQLGFQRGQGVDTTTFDGNVVWTQADFAAAIIAQSVSSGDDFIFDTNTDDVINAGLGNDIIELTGRGNDTVDGGGGEQDQVSLNGSSADYTFARNEDNSVTVSSAAYGIDTLINIHGIWFYGEEAWYGLDELAPPSGGNVITGTSGDDFIFDTDADDIINAGDGSDIIELSGLGNDIVDGGGGAQDQVSLMGSSEDYTFARNEDDSVTVSSAAYGIDTLINIHGIWFYGEEAWYGLDELAPPNAGNIITGTSGDDFIIDTDADDIINAGDGNDIIELSGLGNDTVDGGGGEQDQISLMGSAEDYSFVRNEDNSVTVSSAAYGTDTVINIHGAWFYGEEAWYELDDLAPAYNIASGTSGDDSLVSTAGNDVLTGDEGDDAFVFPSSFGHDIVTDFNAGAATDDFLEFSNSMFADLSAVLASATQVGTDTLITYDGANSVTLKDVAISSLHADDFRFV